MGNRNPHDDFLGYPIECGDLVVGSDGYDSMNLYKVLRTTPKMISVTNVLAKRKGKSKLIYGKAILKVDEHAVIMYMLKYGE